MVAFFAKEAGTDASDNAGSAQEAPPGKNHFATEKHKNRNKKPVKQTTKKH